MYPMIQPTGMTTHELQKASSDHLEFVANLIAAVQARRMFEAEMDNVFPTPHQLS